MEMKVEIVAKETIKPSSATPRHLRTVDLSIIDHFSPSIYTSFIFFYSSTTKDSSALAEMSQKLKKSLSDNLTRFYPFAGRVKDVRIDCNDEGAVFVDAQVDRFLSDFLKNPDLALLELFVPADVLSIEAATWPLLLVQANVFKCGGLVLGVCLSHKFSDAASVATFMKSWSATALGLNNLVFPVFDAATVFPIVEPSLALPEVQLMKQKCVTKRFVFGFSKIAELQDKAGNSTLVKHPTRVEVVTAVLWKCATKASRSNSGFVRRSMLHQAVDVRRRNTKIPLTENNIGNLVFHLTVTNEDREICFEQVVSELRQKKEELNKMCREKLEAGVQASSFSLKLAKEFADFLSNGNDLDFYTCTSWCGLSLYEADFGWGKPVWVTNGATPAFKNIIVLMDAIDNKGIEAWVTLKEEDMSVFEQDTELLAFASPNPSILI